MYQLGGVPGLANVFDVAQHERLQSLKLRDQRLPKAFVVPVV